MPKLHIHTLAATCLLAAAIAAPASSRPVPDYAMFVDMPTAFAYIKLPTGWKFVGKLDAQQLRHLPPGTLTSLLPPQSAD